MKLFRGLAKTDYQDVLRAIGLFIDEHGTPMCALSRSRRGSIAGRVREQRALHFQLRNISHTMMI